MKIMFEVDLGQDDVLYLKKHSDDLEKINGMLQKRISEVEISDHVNFIMTVIIDNFKGKEMKIEDIAKMLKSEKIYDENSFDKAIDLLKRKGDIYEPKRGVISKI